MVLYSYTHMSSLLSSLLYITFGFPNSYEHHATPLKPVVMVLWPAKGSQSVQFSHSVLSYYFQPHGLQHARIPCPSPTSRACSNSCPSNQWCHPTISSSVTPFSSCLQSFPASGYFQMSQFFPLGGQSIGVSASASIAPMNIKDWFP